MVDLDQGSYEIIRSSERHGDYIKNLTGDFAQLMEMALISWTKPPYRERFQQLLDTEALKRRFESGDKKIEFIYKSYVRSGKSSSAFRFPTTGTTMRK